MMKNDPQRAPRKFKLVVVATLLLLVFWPLMMIWQRHVNPGFERALMLVLPVCVLAACYTAYRQYTQRHDIAWILIGTSWLLYVAFFALVYFT